MRRKKNENRTKPRRGIYILPNIFTSLNAFCGFYALISAIDGKFIHGAVAIIIAGVFDALDGKIARATNTTSTFGVEYDSLADLLSFGVAPSIMMYLWALKPLGRIGWLAAFLFAVCGALRLARFNTQSGSSSGEHFTGLPIPAAAGMIAVTLLFYHKLNLTEKPNAMLLLTFVYVLSFLMVSSIKYYSFKKFELFKKMNFNVLVAMILVIVFIAAQPSIALFLIGIVYLFSGPVITLRHLKTAKKKESLARNADIE